MERLELARRLSWTPERPVSAGLACFAPLDSIELEREVAAAAAGTGSLFLCDQNWGHSEHDQVDEILAQTPVHSDPEKGWLCIPTGGTSGKLRFARHDQDTIQTAVDGFLKHFSIKRVNAVGVLPLHHVSGFMSWARCALTGGRFVDWDWKSLESGSLPPRTGGDTWVISLVPTQLQRLMGQPATLDWLRQFRAVFVGGAPAWPSLLDRAEKARLPICLSYGMTETAAMVSVLRAGEFLKGLRGVGKPMPHVALDLTQDGSVRIKGESLFRGYYPDWTDAREFMTEDLGQLDEYGHLSILGRRDAMILSGGKKIAPIEVEAALLATGLITEVAVVGMPDSDWGQRVVACIPDPLGPDVLARIESQLRDSLASYKLPRRYVVVDPWPRNDQGKLNREALLKAVIEAKR